MKTWNFSDGESIIVDDTYRVTVHFVKGDGRRVDVEFERIVPRIKIDNPKRCADTISTGTN